MGVLGLVALVLAFPARASELVRGTTLTDGQQLYASDLHGLIDNTTIGVGFFNDQPTAATLPGTWFFLVQDGGNQVFRRVSAATALWNNTNAFFGPAAATIIPNGRFLWYDPTNNAVESVTYSNLFAGLLSSVNSTSVLAVLDGLLAPISNTFSQVFLPWTVYGTNYSTNVWGTSNVFAITNLNYPANTNLTLADSDTVPVNSVGQGTNTTATLNALYQYMTNRTFQASPYAIARATLSRLTPTNANTALTFNAATHNLYATNHNFVTGWAVTIDNLYWASAGYPPTSVPQLSTNQIYWCRSNSTYEVALYTNKTDALTGNTNSIVITSAGAAGGYYSTLFHVMTTSTFNCEITQESYGYPALMSRPGYYYLWFTTPPGSANYYVAGTAAARFDGYTAYAAMAGVSPLGTNGTPVATTNCFNFGFYASSPTVLTDFFRRAQIMVFPE